VRGARRIPAGKQEFDDPTRGELGATVGYDPTPAADGFLF
jgi:hypothetical protein